MLAKYILLLLAVVFLFASVVRGTRTPQGRTWLLIAVIFGIVSGWLLGRGEWDVNTRRLIRSSPASNTYLQRYDECGCRGFRCDYAPTVGLISRQVDWRAL